MHEIQSMTLEDIMGDRFGRYSKYIIQERALPDIRDGLKPVQRRILYGMHQDGNTFEKAFRKSAKSVGNIMGNYHPHGDSSIYEAMVRMSQNWKLNTVLIEMHGNNGSMDGDPPAAMRYTEARLSEASGMLLEDIEQETVEMVWNFDDTEKEPTVLPAAFPNLLVNGATGISAGYATEIPPYNLSEVIDGTIYLLDHPQASLAELMKRIPGPDFPTGGIMQGEAGLQEALATGRGRVVLRAKTAVEALKGGKSQIVVTEIPYEVNKATMVKKIDEIRLMKKIDGIAEVRDETDRTGLRVVIELKKEANATGILNYLFKNTELQVNYNFNMVAIKNQRPEQVGLKAILESYIEHRQEVIKRRSKFQLKKAQARQHIVEGMIKAVSILDAVIATIRGSKNKKDAKENLMSAYAFSEEQAEAIVTMMLYRLTNTDILTLQKEADELREKISGLEMILQNQETLLKVMRRELRAIKKKFATPRKTMIEAEVEELKIDTEVLITAEDVIVSVTREGYLKRTSLRSYRSSRNEEFPLRAGDAVIYLDILSTMDHLLMFTNHGNVLYRPVHELQEIRWKDFGEHISQTINGLAIDEEILFAYPYRSLQKEETLVFFSQNGLAKQTLLSDFKPWRTYKSRGTVAMKLKEDDQLIKVAPVRPAETEIFLATSFGYGQRFALDELPVVGARAQGVKAVSLKDDDYVVGAALLEGAGQKEHPLVLFTQRGAGKRMLAEVVPKTTRAKRGQLLLHNVKSNPHFLVYSDVADQGELLIYFDTEKTARFDPQDLKIYDRTSNGSFVFDEEKDGKLIYAEPYLPLVLADQEEE